MYLVAVLLLLASCGDYNPPYVPGNGGSTGNSGNNGNSGGSTTPSVSPVASFTYTKEHPFYVYFSNKSTNATSYYWDFGDGTTSYEKSPTHKYSGKGVYNVKLTAKYNGKSDTYTKQITVVEPTTCYITGFVFEMIPSNNEYYKIKLTDDDLFFVDTYINTNWVLLSSANTPYEYKLSTKYKVDFSEDYKLKFYKNSKTSGDGTLVNTWNLSGADINTKFSETRTATGTNVKIITKLEWRD